MKTRISTTFLSLFFICSFSQNFKSKSLKEYKGFFDFYYEESQDKLYLEVAELDKEFLYVNSLASGVGSNDIGLDRGQLGQDRVVKFIKAGNKLLLVQPNQDYRAITDNELEKKSIEQAFAKSVLFGFKIVDTLNGNYIIDMTPFLMQDMHGVASRLKQRKEGSYKVDVMRSGLSLDRTKAFPKNVEFEALLTFKGEPIGKNLRTVAPTASSFSVIQHHSFIELPDDNYKPREFDPRSGAISISYMDYASPVQEDIRKRFIIRHRLEKKDPNAVVSEAVEPIIYYLDPGTPEPVRSALLEGGKWWNQAYEAIGFKDAFQVKMLPPEADPMDCRYNVIQWVHRSTRGWSYGASVVDPRTGEIIKGHVSLGSLRIRQDFMIAQALMKEPFKDNDDNYQPMLELALARIRQLSAHEIGHTLGFAHNFAASTNSRASVMDYPHPHVKISDKQIDFSHAYDTDIGEWDKVTVAYSYSDFPVGINESEELNKILKNATDQGLRFISDQDARPTGGAHALAHLWDNGTNASEELATVMRVRNMAITNFSAHNIRSNEPFTKLEDVFVPLYFYHRYQTEATVKLIGGLDYNYAVKGDGQLRVKPVDGEEQRKALHMLARTLTSNSLAIPEDKLKLFPPRAFQYGRSRESFKSRTGVGFDPVSAAATASDMTAGLILHPERMNRVFLQKGMDSSQLGPDEVFDIMEGFLELGGNYSNYNEIISETVGFSILQHYLNLASHETTYPQLKAIAMMRLNKLKLRWKKNPASAYYADLIEKFEKDPDKFKIQEPPKIPDGSPIGMDICSFQSN